MLDLVSARTWSHSRGVAAIAATLMFSATVPRIGDGSQELQRDAVRIGRPLEQKQHGDIEYRSLLVAPSDRENASSTCCAFTKRGTRSFSARRAPRSTT